MELPHNLMVSSAFPRFGQVRQPIISWRAPGAHVLRGRHRPMSNGVRSGSAFPASPLTHNFIHLPSACPPPCRVTVLACINSIRRSPAMIQVRLGKYQAPHAKKQAPSARKQAPLEGGTPFQTKSEKGVPASQAASKRLPPPRFLRNPAHP